MSNIFFPWSALFSLSALCLFFSLHKWTIGRYRSFLPGFSLLVHCFVHVYSHFWWYMTN
ncbi:hypothetical protein K503DRAFT_770339 [Rhizopogon vinicolor AM-OR11-026]|uniref:Uncharacterized protein n=1 Tax=Rhizopogon vinicolor AM-OR11-026 TaxID=1314800 RepID=A0A1B7N161_9AGAM|nr:hypothetical protein K503DRAFT_770339 [Rhizopogon vinicolor AM-OR11-026]